MESSKQMHFKLLYGPDLQKIEIEITTKCNLMCKFCDRRCSQAPSKESMSLEQIRQFVEESIQMKYEWKNITILGGEPALHPDLEEIIRTIKTYTLSFPDCDLSLITNYHGNAVIQKIDSISNLINVIKRPKTTIPEYFQNIDLAPVDFGNVAFSCNIVSVCGLGLSSRGYFPCGAGAAIARVLDLDIGVKSLSDVNQTSMRNILRMICMYCGHCLNKKVTENYSISPFWEQAYREYRERSMVR
jgi:hypothetical protein